MGVHATAKLRPNYRFRLGEVRLRLVRTLLIGGIVGNPGYDTPPRGVPMAALITTLFWDKKLKIAILTLATFAALC